MKICWKWQISHVTLTVDIDPTKQTTSKLFWVKDPGEDQIKSVTKDLRILGIISYKINTTNKNK